MHWLFGNIFYFRGIVAAVFRPSGHHAALNNRTKTGIVGYSVGPSDPAYASRTIRFERNLITPDNSNTAQARAERRYVNATSTQRDRPAVVARRFPDETPVGFPANVRLHDIPNVRALRLNQSASIIARSPTAKRFADVPTWRATSGCGVRAEAHRGVALVMRPID